MGNSIPAKNKIIWTAVLLISIVYISGLFVPLMDNDSAHHAGIALHMYLTGNYTFLIDQGQPYLDKPHLLFWLSALSYNIFGVNTFAYKFPSLLFTILGIYSTYRLGALLYTKKAGWLASLILSTSCAFVLANNDVRMEAILTGAIIFAVWQLYEYVAYKKFKNMALAALGLALGFSTKGMIGVVIPACAILFNLIYQGKWNMIFHWRWLLLVLMFGFFIFPVVYSYYLQFDLHPETTVRGVNNISGVKFILWNQNIERMKGEGHLQKHKDFFFFFHTFLWAFLPWSLAAIVAAGSGIKSIFKTAPGGKRPFEILTVGPVVFFMIFFSLSNFKLPHYLNCLFPLFSIMLGGFLAEKEENIKHVRLFRNIQLFSVILTVILALILDLWIFPVSKPAVAVVLILLLGVWLGTFFIRTSLFNKSVAFTFTAAIFIFASLNMNFYPRLLTYQAGNELAFKTEDRHIDPKKVYNYMPEDYSFSYDFYTAWQHAEISLDSIKASEGKKQELWVLTSEEGKSDLEKNGIKGREIYAGKDFRVSVLKPKFLNPATRAKAVTTMYLIKLF